MATFTVKGGTAQAAQIETFTLNNDFDDSETDVRITMTDEDGTTQFENITGFSGVDEAAIATLLLAELQGSSQSLFKTVTWTRASNVITGTAKIGGVPFLAASAVTGTGTSTDSVTTASAGPNDMGLAANYVEAAAPSSGATNIVNVLPHPTDERSYSWLYSLDQSGVNVRDFTIGSAFTGDIGQTSNGHYLKIDVNQSNAKLVFNSRGRATWLQGTFPTVYVIGGINSVDMLHLKGTIGTIYASGAALQGRITIADSADFDVLHVHEAPGVTVKVGAGVTSFDTLNMDSGQVVLENNPDSATMEIAGGTLTAELDTWSNTYTINQRGGRVNFNAGCSGTMTYNLFAGELSFVGSKVPSVTFTTLNQYSGHLDTDNGLDNVTISTHNRFGGTVRGAGGSPTFGHA